MAQTYKSYIFDLANRKLEKLPIESVYAMISEDGKLSVVDLPTLRMAVILKHKKLIKVLR